MTRASDKHFDEFRGHTLLKHLVLRKYVGAWAAKVRTIRREAWFIDAFAGEGADNQGNPGSPLIAARLAAPLEADGLGVMRVVAVEKDRTRFERLSEIMAPFTDATPKVAHVRHGVLNDYIDGLMTHIGDKPALFFLDPFGVDGMLVDLLPKALQGPQNEIFALFADVGANRLHAVLVAPGRDPDAEEAAVRATPSLFPEFDDERAAAARLEAQRSARALRNTQVPSERILTEALGPAAIEELAGVPEGERRDRLTRIFMRRLNEAGATYVLSLPVRDESNQHVYQLVYATKSAVGLRTMKEAMDSALKNAPLPQEAVATMRAELRGNEGVAAREIARHFAGREVRWTEEANRGDADTVRRYLLEQTALFPMQFDAVKAELRDAGYVSLKRPLTFKFPP